MAGYRAVLFDFFGTLTQAVRRGPWHRAVPRGLGCEPDAFFTALDRSYRARCRGVFGNTETALRWICDQLGAEPTSDQLRSAARVRVSAVRNDIQLRPEAVSVLRTVRAYGLATAVVSDCAHELPAFFPELPVAPLVDARVFSAEVGQCKPHPDLYLAACDQLGVRPQECLYVGDGDGRELSGAAAVGMTALRLAADDLGGHLAFAPDPYPGPTVRTLAEVIGVLSRPVWGPRRAERV